MDEFISAADALRELHAAGKEMSHQRFDQILKRGYAHPHTGENVRIYSTKRKRQRYISWSDWEEHKTNLVQDRDYRGARKVTKCKQLEVAAARIKELRETMRLTQAQFANVMGWNQAKVSLLEKGKYQITLCDLFHLAAAFGCDLAALIPDFEVSQKTTRLSELLQERARIQVELDELLNGDSE